MLIKKLNDRTGKILPGGTIISDMEITFKVFFKDGGNEAIEMKDIIAYSHTGIITKDLHDLGQNYKKNKEFEKIMKIIFNNMSIHKENKIRKISEKKLENTNFISLINKNNQELINEKNKILNIKKKNKKKKKKKIK